jgi:uncharacterized membrane protein (UPF0127 family)
MMLSDDAENLLTFIDQAEEIRRKIVAFRTSLPTNTRSHCDKAIEGMKGVVGTLRVTVGERVVADHLGVEVERKF